MNIIVIDILMFLLIFMFQERRISLGSNRSIWNPLGGRAWFTNRALTILSIIVGLIAMIVAICAVLFGLDLALAAKRRRRFKGAAAASNSASTIQGSTATPVSPREVEARLWGGAALVVEGYFDVLSLHAGGVPAAVGCMGTALQHQQLEAAAGLAGHRGTVVLALDGDDAGRQATARLCSGLLAETHGR